MGCDDNGNRLSIGHLFQHGGLHFVTDAKTANTAAVTVASVVLELCPNDLQQVVEAPVGLETELVAENATPTNTIMQYMYKPEAILHSWMLARKLTSTHIDLKTIIMLAMELSVNEHVLQGVATSIQDGTLLVPTRSVISECVQQINMMVLFVSARSAHSQRLCSLPIR